MESGSVTPYLNLFSKTSTFVSIDVVGSTRLKAGQNEQDVIYTFLSYHKLVEQLSYNQHGEVIHITGDGMMCRFQRADDALRMSEALLGALSEFNKKQNRLSQPLSLRVGVHTGEVLESQNQASGQIISQTLDITAKLQQSAPPDYLHVSEATFNLVPEVKDRYKRLGWDAALQITVYEFGLTDSKEHAARKLPDSVRVLVVEQELDEISKIKKTLFGHHHEAFTVYTQNQAALCVAAWNPHMVLLSADLPWNTGWEFMAGMRADKKLSGLPIIMMSRETTGDTIQKSFRLGANGFLRKPMDEQQIAKRVEMVLREFYL